MKRSLSFVVALYAAVVLAALGATPFWMDEVQHFGNVRSHTWTELIHWVQVNPGAVPLSYLIQEWAVRTLGLSTFAARLPAALSGIAAAAMFAVVCLRLKLSRPILVLILFIAVPLQFRYATEGLGYSQALLFCLISFWAFLRLIDQPSVTWASVYAGSVALGLYAQPLIIFPALAQILWMGKFGTKRQFFLVTGAVALSVVLFLPWYFPQKEVQRVTGTMKLYFFSWQQIRPLVLLHDLAGGGYVVAIPLILLGCYGLYTLRDRSMAILLGMTVAAAWLGPLLADGLFNYFFAPRQLLFAVPFLVLAAGAGASALWNDHQRCISAALVATFLSAALIRDYHQAVTPKDDLAAASRTVLAWLQPDGCMTVAPAGSAAYFTFLEPDLAGRDCTTIPDAARVVMVDASWATAADRQTIPKSYVRTRELALRELHLSLYERLP